jgi:hypothetical protein
LVRFSHVVSINLFLFKERKRAPLRDAQAVPSPTSLLRLLSDCLAESVSIADSAVYTSRSILSGVSGPSGCWRACKQDLQNKMDRVDFWIRGLRRSVEAMQ